MKELKRLRLKFVVSNMAMVTLVIGLAFFAVGFFTKMCMDRDSQQMLDQAAAAQGVQKFITSAGGARLPYFILVTDGENQIIRVESQYGMEPDNEALKGLAAQSLSAVGDQGVLEHYQLRYLRQPFENGWRIAYMDTSLGQAFTANMWKSLAVIGLVMWLALLGVSCQLSKWAVAPVSRSMRREKQFLADASHELKTPLTVIMANAQLMEEQQENTGDFRRWLDNILQESREMKHLVEEMLTLARNEAGEFQKTRKRCCLSDLVIQEVLSFEAVYYQENKELDSDVEEEIEIFGEESSLRRLVGILLDNAVKYSSPESRTRVCLKRVSARKARLMVADQGEEIPKEKLEELFERFYRSDSSRSGKKGYGLGLAIAKTIAETHGAKIYAESEQGENRFFVEFRLDRHRRPGLGLYCSNQK